MADEAATKAGFNLKRFLEETRGELKKVSWSTKNELITYTQVVFVAVVIVCALIWICDTIFARLFHIILK